MEKAQTTFIGQEAVQKRISLWIETNFRTNTLFRGGPGSGKTTLAKIYAEAISGGDYYYHLCTSGTRIDPPEGAKVILLDEIHNLKNEEAWYEFPGVLIGCTTEGAPISEPLMTRMTEIWMDEYTLQELAQIVVNKVSLTPIAAYAISLRARGNPRVALRLAREVQTYTGYYGAPKTDSPRITLEEYGNILDQFDTMPGGYTKNDLLYLEALGALGGTASLATLTATLGLSRSTLTDEIEPFLLSKKVIVITSKGRALRS